jgi:hypothetical protein
VFLNSCGIRLENIAPELAAQAFCHLTPTGITRTEKKYLDFITHVPSANAMGEWHERCMHIILNYWSLFFNLLPQCGQKIVAILFLSTQTSIGMVITNDSDTLISPLKIHVSSTHTNSIFSLSLL